MPIPALIRRWIVTNPRRIWRDSAAFASPIIEASQRMPDDVSYDPTRFTTCAAAIVSAGKKLGAQGLTPATSSNFSMRMDAKHAAITISGRDKGTLTLTDIMVIDMDGNAVGTSARPSAETLLHTQIYKQYPDVNAVLHTHSRN